MKRKLFPVVVVAGLLGVILFATDRDSNDYGVVTVRPQSSQAPANSTRSDVLEVDPAADQLNSENEAIRKGSSFVYDQLQSVPYWQLIEEHWKKANEGDADSMVIVHAIMKTCRSYRKRFDGKDIAEVQADFSANNDPQLYALNEKIWEICVPIYQDWNQYDGWKDMLERAGDIGQPYAMTVKGQALLRGTSTFDEGVSLIETALYSRDYGAFAQVADIYFSAGIDPGVSYGWLLAACEFGLDCSADGVFMKNTCGPFSQNCGIHESVRDFILRNSGDNGLETAGQRAAVIVNAVVNDRIDDLNIELDLQKP